MLTYLGGFGDIGGLVYCYVSVCDIFEASFCFSHSFTLLNEK